MHTKRLYPILPQNLLLGPIHISQTNIHQFAQIQHSPLPQGHINTHDKNTLILLPCQPRQERNRHPVDIPAPARLWRVDIRMRIHPNHRHIPVQSCLYRAARAGDRADGDGVVAAEGEHESAGRGVRVHLLGQRFGDGGYGARVLHPAVRGVVGREQCGVVVHGVVVVQGVAEVDGELGEEAGGYEGRGRGFDAGFVLWEEG